MALYKDKILFVDENELFCEGVLKHFTSSQNIYEIAGVANDWVEVLSKTEKLAPNIVIINIRIMHSDWIETSRQIRQKFPFTTIIVLSESKQNVREALRAGVNAFISMELCFGDILRIIGSVNERSCVVFPDNLVRTQGMANSDEPRGGRLSKREGEILVLLAKGLQNKEIAYRLSINIQTVNNHIYNIFRKLGSSNRTEAVLSAVKKGLIEIGS